ncbi:MAG: hypothetical protein ACTTKH_03455 [Treponema sp.]
MKQRKVLSMIVALVIIISAVVLIIGCSQPDSNKGNTINNGGNNSNNGGNTASPLEEVIMVTGTAENDIRTYYFSRGSVYYTICYSSGLTEKSIKGSYSGSSITTSSFGTVTCTVNADEVILFFGKKSRAFPRIKESESLYKTIKNAPVNK